MPRLTLALVREPVAEAIGVCATDARVAKLVNRAQKRLCDKGKWVGTVVRYRVCLTEGCLVWPRQIQTIEAYALCDWPGVVRDQFFEFQGNGYGLISATNTCSGSTLVDRDPRPTFDQPRGVDKKLRVYADVAEASTAKILVQGYDENSNWIRTQLEDGTWVDGEYIIISQTPMTSVRIFTAITGVIKPETNGVVRIYEYDPATTVQRALAFYEPDETHPLYRCSLVPGLSETGGCCNASNDCSTRAVTVLAKLQPMPVARENDWLLLGHLDAIVLMCQALDLERKKAWDEAAVYEAQATRLLTEELSSYIGDGSLPTLRTASSNEWGGGGVLNAI